MFGSKVLLMTIHVLCVTDELGGPAQRDSDINWGEGLFTQESRSDNPPFLNVSAHGDLLDPCRIQPTV